MLPLSADVEVMIMADAISSLLVAAVVTGDVCRAFVDGMRINVSF